LPFSLSQPGCQSFGAVRCFRDEAHGELAHDGQQLGLNTGSEPPAAVERSRDQPVQALDGPVQPGHSRIVRKRHGNDGRFLRGHVVLVPASCPSLSPPGCEVGHFIHDWIVAATSDMP